jgi:nucleoid-associated protein YgaU
MALTFETRSTPPAHKQLRGGVLVDPWFLSEPVTEPAASAEPVTASAASAASAASSGRHVVSGRRWDRQRADERGHTLARSQFSWSALVSVGVCLLMIVAIFASLTSRADASPPQQVWIVSEGESLWGIARELQPTGDVRPLVQRLTLIHGSSGLQPGDSITIPADLSYTSE